MKQQTIYNKFLVCLVILLFSFSYLQAVTLTEADVDISFGRIGCYNAMDCGNSLCREGCVDCTSNTICTSCQYGYFLYHTPQNTVECIKCPHFDPSGTNANEKNKCATCLEMPTQWEYIRKCTFKYFFPDNDGAKTPRNVTMNKPELYKVTVDTNVAQDFTSTRYSTSQLTAHCSEYEWKNYELLTHPPSDDEIEEILNEFNDSICTACQTGYIYDEDNVICNDCSVPIPQCKACYETDNTLACSICKTGYTPSSEQDECLSCSSQIDNCSDCYFNANHDEIQCTTCKSGFRLSQDKLECQRTQCADPNCLRCATSNDSCDKCISRFELVNSACQVARECKDLDGEDCDSCFAAVAGSSPTDCLFCGEEMGSYTCLELCRETQGWDYNAGTPACFKCSDENYHSDAVEDCGVCKIENPSGAYRCIACKTDFGLIKPAANECFKCEDEDVGGMAGCSECEKNNGVFECRKCDKKGYGFDGETNTCFRCSDYDANCSSCERVLQAPAPSSGDPYIFECNSCNSPYQVVDAVHGDGGNPGSCELDCSQKFSTCDSSECIKNTKYLKASEDIFWYPAQEVICNVCSQQSNAPASLSADGSQCYQNSNFCLNSLKLSTIASKSINLAFAQNNPNSFDNQECFNECDGEYDNSTDVLFMDPVLKKCKLCPIAQPMCRSTIIYKKYIYCQTHSSFHSSISSYTPVALSALTDSDFEFNFDFTQAPYNTYNDKLYSNFKFEIFFIGSSSDPDKNICNLDYFYWPVTSNIAENIFRINELSVSFKTFNNDDGTVNSVQMEMYSLYAELEVSGLSKFSIEKINFLGGVYLTPEQQYEYDEGFDEENSIIHISDFQIKMKNNLPNSQFYLDNVNFYSSNQYQIIPKFTLEDLGTLSIKNFEYYSMLTTAKLQTGFNLFDFIIYRGITEFNLYISNFILEDMLIEETAIFQIPLKDAYVVISDVTITNCIFKQAYLLKDISSGFGNGRQWIIMENINVEKSQLFDTTLVDVHNARYFLADNWQFNTIHIALKDNKESQVIKTNTFIFYNLSMKKITLYQATLFKQIQSPSIVVYYEDTNFIGNMKIENIEMVIDESKPLMDFSCETNFAVQNFEMKNVKKLNAQKINSGVRTYLLNEDFGVSAVSAYIVQALSEIEVPAVLVSITSKLVGGAVFLENFYTDKLGALNVMNIINANDVNIKNYFCYETKEDPQEGYCLKADLSEQPMLNTFEMTNAKAFNIKTVEEELQGNPISIRGFQKISLTKVTVLDAEVLKGLYIAPKGEATVKVNKCRFEQIVTPTELKLHVQGGGLYIDLIGATKAKVDIERSIFNGIYARYQSAGLFLYDPTVEVKLTINSCIFNDVHSIDGGVMHLGFGNQQSAQLKISNTKITGGHTNKSFSLQSISDGELHDDGENTEEISTTWFQDGEGLPDTIPQMDGELYTIVHLLHNAQSQLAKSDGEKEVLDPALTTAIDTPSAVYIKNAVVSMDTVTIENIHHQQALVMDTCQLTATKLHFKDNQCITCSVLQGSSHLVTTQFNITDSVFESCQSISGGALFITSATSSSNKYFNTISGSTFKNNMVVRRGGGLYIQDSYYEIKNCIFENNKAVGLFNEDSIVDSIRGEGGGVFTQISDQLETSATPTARRRMLATTTVMKVTSNTFKKNFAQAGAAGRFTGVSIESSSNTVASDNEATEYGSGIVDKCIYGEGKNQDNTCEVCAAGKYSVSIDAANCLTCPKNTECQGKSVMVINENYWRPNNYSDKVLHCYNQPANCLGGRTNFTCQIGYIGALCEACDLRGIHTNGTQYSVSSAYNCGTCDDAVTNGFKVFYANVITLVSMLLAVKGTIKLIQDKIQLKAIKTLFRGFKSVEDETGILIKMFTNYFQIISIIATFQIDIPNGIVNVQDSVGNPVKSMGNALDCYLINLQDAIPNIYFRIVWQLVMNILQFSVFLLFFVIAKMLKKTSISFRSLTWTTFIYLLIYLQPSYVNAILEAVSCRKLGGYDYIVADVQYHCYSSEYDTWTYYFLIPFLIFWVLVLPAWMFSVLYSNYKEGQLSNSICLYKYGFIYQEYEERVFYWELIKVFQKTIIVAVIQLYSQEIKIKAILVFMMVFIYGVVSYLAHPYNSRKLNEIDILSSIVCSLSLIIGIFLYNNDYIYWIIIGFFVIFAINLWFVIFMIKQILNKVIRDTIKKQGDKIEKAKEKIPALKKVVKLSPQQLERIQQLLKIFKTRVRLYTDGIKAGIVIGYDYEQQIREQNKYQQKQQQQNIKVKQQNDEPIKLNEGDEEFNQDMITQTSKKRVTKKTKKSKKQVMPLDTLIIDKLERTMLCKQQEQALDDEEHQNEMREKFNTMNNDSFNPNIPLLEEWKGPQFTAKQILMNELDEKDLMVIEGRVGLYRYKEYERFLKQREFIRDYYYEALKWPEFMEAVEHTKKKNDEKALIKKAKKLAKKEKIPYEAALEKAKKEEEEEQKKIEEEGLQIKKQILEKRQQQYEDDLLKVQGIVPPKRDPTSTDKGKEEDNEINRQKQGSSPQSELNELIQDDQLKDIEQDRVNNADIEKQQDQENEQKDQQE